MTAEAPTWPGLAGLTGPQTVQAVPAGELPALAGRIRKFLIEKVCAAGGHLSTNLGMVELTLALHRVFDSPRDTLVFDNGSGRAPTCSSSRGGASAIHSPTASSKVAPASTAHAVSASTTARR